MQCDPSGAGVSAVSAGTSGRQSNWKSAKKTPLANIGPAMSLDPDYTVVSDFRATGATRGSIFPVMDLAGDVLRPRKPGDTMTDITEDRPDLSPPQRTHKRSPNALLADRREAQRRIVAERSERREKRMDRFKRRYDLLMTYDCRGDKPGPGEYLVAVYHWTVGDLVSTPCSHRHLDIGVAIWCKSFPSTDQPTHVVIVDSRSTRVKRSVRKR